jgi:EAL domain-containing protein (putative c-di-GMP-specific phosphodiesterase class I)
MQEEKKRWAWHDDSPSRGGVTAPSADHQTTTTTAPLPPPGAERALIDTAERAMRAPRGKVALALHLCRLKPPAPRPHHTRIARALLQETAQRYAGQLFALRNGDLLLLCTLPPEENRLAGGQSSPLALPATLLRLFGVDAPEQDRLTTIWRLEEEADRFWAFLTTPQGESAAEPLAEDHATSAAGIIALEELVATAFIPDLLSQQTAIHLHAGRDLPLTARLTPLFREITFSRAALARRPDMADALADPFLFRHFATRLDARILEHLHDDLAQGGRLTRATLRQNLPLHLNLTPESIVSTQFARLADAAQRSNARFGVEVSLMHATADPRLMGFASRLLDMAGFPLIIDGIDHVGLTMAHPAGLRPALVKLRWSPRLADPAPTAKAAIAAALGRVGAERVVLYGAETEDALLWGQAHGIRQFQGYFLDAVQAATRIAFCHSARACTLRQCTTRGGALSPTIRGGCGNPALLDMAPTRPAPDTPRAVIPAG